MTTRIIAGARVIRGGRGPKGLSAYQQWLKAGNTGTEADYLASLIGAGGIAADTLFDDSETQIGVTTVQAALELLIARHDETDLTFSQNVGLALNLGVI